METFKTDAINLKTYPISENDNIVVMFSKDLGLIKGVAKEGVVLQVDYDSANEQLVVK